MTAAGCEGRENNRKETKVLGGKEFQFDHNKKLQSGKSVGDKKTHKQWFWVCPNRKKRNNFAPIQRFWSICLSSILQKCNCEALYCSIPEHDERLFLLPGPCLLELLGRKLLKVQNHCVLSVICAEYKMWQYTQFTRRDDIRYWVHENETRKDFHIAFKKTKMTKYMTKHCRGKISSFFYVQTVFAKQGAALMQNSSKVCGVVVNTLAVVCCHSG